jgi:hypothetical protein
LRAAENIKVINNNWRLILGEQFQVADTFWQFLSLLQIGQPFDEESSHLEHQYCEFALVE